jgi:DNA repair exonuclease SbcCD ATPase subunit
MNNDFDVDALFSDAAEADTAQETNQNVDAYEQQEKNFTNFEDDYKTAEEGLEENPIYKIITSGQTGAEIQDALIAFTAVEVGEESDAVVQELANIVKQYAELSSITSSAVRAANNIDQAEVFNQTLEKIHGHQETYTDLSEMYNQAIQALMAAQKEGRGIKDIISETKQKRTELSGLKDSMISQSEATEEAQGEYDAQISKQKKLQLQVDEAQAIIEKYKNGCEEVKDEQGIVTQKKIPALAALEAAFAAESGGFFFFKNDKKEKIGAAIEKAKKEIKDADEIVDNINPQVTNLEGPISRSKATLDEAKTEFQAQQDKYKQLEDELANDATIKAVEELIGNGDSKHFTEQAKKFGNAGEELIKLMNTELASCVDFYVVQQENQQKLMNTSSNLSSQLKSVVAGLRKGLTKHEKAYKELTTKLEDSIQALDDKKASEIETAKAVENEEERLELIDDIEKKYMDLPPHVKQMKEDQRDYQNFASDYSARLDQISSFEQHITVALETTNVTHQNAVNLTRKSESLKNEQVTMVNNSTTNATATVAQLLQEININMIAEFGQAASKTNALINQTGVSAMVHRQEMANKDKAQSIKSLSELTKTMKSAKASLEVEAEKSVALQKMNANAAQQFEKSAQELVNTTMNSESNAKKRMQEDSAYAKQAVASTKSLFEGPKPKEPGV